MAIVIPLLGFNDLGSLVTPTFLFRNRFYIQLSPHYPKMKKKSMWEVKKISRFLSTGHGILPSCGSKARETTNSIGSLRSLNTNCFFDEPRQLTEFTKYVHLNHIWQGTFPFKALIAIFWDLQSSSLTKPDYSGLGVFQGMFSPKRSRWPPFFLPH